uniref:CRIB domain-containing protein n=1 Tax=Romanomermis culicivorax TaxID=13658 RepID=A0A915L4N9_ROMCU
MISGPSDFCHVEHMGPPEGIERQQLIDVANLRQQQQQSQPHPLSHSISGAQQIVERSKAGLGPVMRSSSAGHTLIHGISAANSSINLPPTFPKQPTTLSNHGKSSSLGRSDANNQAHETSGGSDQSMGAVNQLSDAVSQHNSSDDSNGIFNTSTVPPLVSQET